MDQLASSFPEQGAKITYREAIESYDVLERHAVGLVYNELFSPCAGAYDLLQAIDGAAEKYGISDAAEISELRCSLRAFSCERTSLANGVDGERFHLAQNPEKLDAFDRTHIFEVGVDGRKLIGDVETVISLIRKETELFDEYSDVFSRKPATTSRIARERSRRENDKVDAWLARTMAVAMCCLTAVCALHSVGEIIAITRFLG